MTLSSTNLLRGTVELLILTALDREPLHGYAITEWLDRVTEGEVLLEEGTLYTALHRLEAKGLLESEWGLSENNRRAKFYRLTASGRKRMRAEQRAWRRHYEAVLRALAEGGGGA